MPMILVYSLKISMDWKQWFYVQFYPNEIGIFISPTHFEVKQTKTFKEGILKDNLNNWDWNVWHMFDDRFDINNSFQMFEKLIC